MTNTEKYHEHLKASVLPCTNEDQLAQYLDALLDQLAAVHAEIRRRARRTR